MKQKYLLLGMALLFFLIFFSATSLALIPGDFGSADNGPPDGVVDFEDLMIFALAYGSTPSDTNWNPDCDIYPDGIIDFEDLMIFALHYGECAPPSAPTLSDPGTNLPSPANYIVSWSAVAEASSYLLQEATSSDFTSGLQEHPLTDTSKSFSHTVSTTTTYYYRVAAVNDCGRGDWSNVGDIIINCCTLPSAPILSDPGSSLPSPANYTVSWPAVTTATSYVLQEATSSDFTSGLQEYPLTDTSKDFSHTVTTTTTYYYRVAAVNSCGQSGWSSVEDITVVTGPVHNLTKDTYYNSIQVALNAADTDNTIEVNDGTYDESVTFPSDKVIILQSINGASSTIIRGNDGSYTVTFSGSSLGTTLKGFTITHAEGSAGSGVYIFNSNLTINNCTISDNTGIGIYNYGILTITSSNISGNTATGTAGGGIYNFSGTITITSSTISGNTAGNAAGIYNSSNGTLTITSSTISDNTATGYGGGGIYNYSGTITITSSTISGNTAGRGGGIFNYNGGNVTITSSDISSNTATGYGGGGIYNYSNGTLTITLSTISSNTAGTHGGGIYNYNTGTLTITRSDISGNTGNVGAGIYNYSSATFTITSSTISGNNVSLQGGGIYLTGTGINIIGGNDASDTSNFNTFTDNKKNGTVSAAQHICNPSGDCRSSYPYNYYIPN